jgi:hypothetical protein
MCILLLLSSPTELPVHKYAGHPNDKFDSQIFACETHLANSDDARAIFRDRVIYHIGAQFTGDGCGFGGAFDKAFRCRQELADLIDHLLNIEADLTLYVAYHDFGQSGELPRSLDFLGPNDIRTWKEYFEPNEFFQLIES